MELLKERILRDGVYKPGGILKVDSFLNHQMDIELINAIGREFARRFANVQVTKILTVESSGIGIACLTAQYFGVPVLFAKKAMSKNIDGELYTALVHSYTKDIDYTVRVERKFLTSSDHVLLIDDFLANGQALLGLINIVKQSGAALSGAGICIEKGFQPGGKTIRSMGINLQSLVIVNEDANGNLCFAD